MLFIGNRFKKKHLLVSESFCTMAVVLFIYVSYTNKMFIPKNKPYTAGLYNSYQLPLAPG
jgi:hypothetical protein